MSDAFRLGKSVVNLTSSPQFDDYSKVVITVTDDLSYSAGTDTGRVLSLSCPWGTQKMANDILNSIKEYKYQPYIANGAILDPAAELGDGVSIQNVYGGIYSRDIRFGGLCASDISAPEEKEIDHEYPYVPKQERRVTRQLSGLTKSYGELKVAADQISASVEAQGKEIGNMQGTLSVQATQISAKVEKSGGSNASFGWELDEKSWKLKSKGTDVLKATESGLEIKGKITATGGTIGGFTINGNSMSTNSQTWKGTNATGIYIGPEGIQLGKNFRVDNQGNMSASSGTFTGEISAKSIKFGKDAATGIDYGKLSGSAISDGSITGTQIQANGIGTAKLSKGIKVSLGYADFSNDVFNGKKQAEYTKTKIIDAKIFYFNGYQAYIDTITYLDASGTASTATVLKAIRL